MECSIFLLLLFCSVCWINAKISSKLRDEPNDEGRNGSGAAVEEDDDDNGKWKKTPVAQFVPKRGRVSGVQPERRPFMQKVIRQPIPMSPQFFLMFGSNRRKAWFSRFG
ncbi:uncharacterized protein LOC114533288 [Dendronephthya gigantea]|uniref:uncharacterized protein LOC114533288 n=1 Tax=Dendronephthya gigantea TaxID=151771 RepID=UPI001069D61D|nr:uncharacterized protein LOC114533288 [Dendronephthya gigantea]